LLSPGQAVPDRLSPGDARRVVDPALHRGPALQLDAREGEQQSVVERRLRGGQRLPSTRALAAELVEAIRRELCPLLEVVGAEAGFHLTATLALRTGDRAIAEAAARDGLWAMPLSACYLGSPTQQGLVLGYGGASVAQIPGAVARLRRAVCAA
jgi:hypothetical protein